jgi:hypothetical protein
MALHGSASGPLVLSRLSGEGVARTASMRASTTDPSGFRHFLGSPAPADRFKINGAPYDPANPAHRAEALPLMRLLALRLEREPPPAGGAFDNPNIPSGYTYFFQLAAHDLVNSTAFLSLSEGRLATIANMRTAPLRLETIFAEGPAARPELYERKTEASRFHPLLRVGPLREDGALVIGQQPAIRKERLDIARGICPFSDAPRKTGLPEAIIGDARNDDHPLLSQLVVLFHYVHNTIVCRVAADPAHPLAGSPFDMDHLNYLCARSATTLIYRSIIRHDLLDRLLHPDVRAAYEAQQNLVRDQTVGLGDRWCAPFELTHSVLRAAHGMIRPSYKFNVRSPEEEFTLQNMLLQSSDDQPDQMPLQRKWAADWSFFFGPKPKNLSRRIRPHFDQHLSAPGVFPAENGDKVAGLAYRDLLSGIDTAPWSLEALVRKLRPTHGALLALSPLFPDPPPAGSVGGWQAPFAQWLQAVPASASSDQFPAAAIDSLSKDPPLGVFVAFEAASDPAAKGGERFGVLGSIILADVLYDILRNDELVTGAMDLTLLQQMEELSRTVFPDGPNLLSFIPNITSFDGLLDFMRPWMPQFPST